MTLKKKFADAIHVPLADRGFYIDWDKVEECEKIADEFAVEFGEYLDSLTAEDMGTTPIKEFLEFFKKEKGL